MYVADHYVLPRLTHKQIEAIAGSHLSMDGMIRDTIAELFSFRFATVPDYLTALAVERRGQAGQARGGAAVA